LGNHSNIGENVRITALKGAKILLAPHQTGGCDSPDPHTMGLVDRRLWENRHADPAVIEAERGPKGQEGLMRWLPARAHDQGGTIAQWRERLRLPSTKAATCA
jgi:hypothetical protein